MGPLWPSQADTRITHPRYKRWAIKYEWHKYSDSGEEGILLIQSVFCASTLRDVCLRALCALREKPSEELIFAKYFP